MSNAISSHDPIVGKLINSFGLKNVTHLEIVFDINAIVKVKAEFYPEKESVEEVAKLLQEYELHKVDKYNPYEDPKLYYEPAKKISNAIDEMVMEQVDREMMDLFYSECSKYNNKEFAKLGRGRIF